MLCLKTLSYLHRPFLPLRSIFSSSSAPSPVPLSSSLSFRTSTRFSSTISPMATTVEHFVLFAVKPSVSPTQVDALVSNLQSLTSLPYVTHLTTTPILRHRSSAAKPFTHILHGRYPTKADLAAYSASLSHVDVVREFVLPVCDDIMAFDWVGNLHSGSPLLKPASAARLTLVKVKEGVEETAKDEILEVLGGVKGSELGIEQVSYGLNFSPGRAKGYEVGLLTVFNGLEELDGLDAMGEELEKQKEKVRPLMESVIVVDFVVPSPATAASL